MNGEPKLATYYKKYLLNVFDVKLVFKECTVFRLKQNQDIQHILSIINYT